MALDQNKDTAAATSTGGYTLKFPGRIGDSPLIGCGNYADNEAGACSATGIGEVAIKLVLAKSACDLMRLGRTAQEAVEELIKLVNCSPHFCWAYMTFNMKQPKGTLRAKLITEAK